MILSYKGPVSEEHMHIPFTNPMLKRNATPSLIFMPVAIDTTGLLSSSSTLRKCLFQRLHHQRDRILPLL